MNEKTVSFLSVAGAALVGFAFLGWWFVHNPVKGFTESLPGRDGRPADFVSRSEAVDMGALFSLAEGKPSALPGSWPRFRGRDFDNISKDDVPLAENWDDVQPEILWSVDLGEGHAGPVVSNGRIYLLDYDEENRADVLRCLSFDDGREIWRRGYEVFIKRNHGMSRTVPAVSDKYVITMGPMCHVMCVDAVSGDFKWGIDLVEEYHAEVPLWYTGQCPLIDGTQAVLAVGGDVLLIGVDCESGEVVWEVPNPDRWKMSHSSVIPSEIAGKRMYLYCALGGVLGVSAEPEDTGRVLFASTVWNKNVIAPSPVPLGDGRVFLAAGYGAGSMMIAIKEDNGSFTVESLQTLKPEEGLASEQQTPIFYKEHLFAVLPKDAGPLRNQFVCCHPDDSRRIVWSSGKTNRFGLGPFIVADDKFFILSDDGVLTMARADTVEYIPIGQAKILDGVDAWGPMAIVNGRLLARDSRRMVCVDLRSSSPKEP